MNPYIYMKKEKATTEWENNRFAMIMIPSRAIFNCLLSEKLEFFNTVIEFFQFFVVCLQPATCYFIFNLRIFRRMKES